MKRIIIILIVIFSLSLTGCSKSADKGSYTENSLDRPEESIESPKAEDDSAVAPAEGNEVLNGTFTEGERKIISKAEVQLETLEFEKSIDKLNGSIEEVKGYLEASNVYKGRINEEYKENRWGEYTVRIPKDKFEGFLASLKEVGNITNTSSSGEDVSSQYYDTETRVKVLKAQETRYLELLNQAQNMEDILKIEDSLTNVRYEIERLTGYLNKIDGLVDYGTVNIRLEEVSKTTVLEKTPTTLSGKLFKAFSNSIKSLKSFGEGILLFIVILIPYIVIIIPLGLVGFFIYKGIEKKKKMKN